MSPLEEAKNHFNEPILVGFELGRCIGYAEDDEDCYLLVKYPHRGVIRCSCVGGYVFLNSLKEQNRVVSKTGEEWNDFTRLDSFLALNGAQRELQFTYLTDSLL